MIDRRVSYRGGGKGGTLGFLPFSLPLFPHFSSLLPPLSPSFLISPSLSPLLPFPSLQMKDDFLRLEDDMTLLGSKMEEITGSSGSINAALADRKKEISKLCGVHHLLKKVV